MGFEFMMSSPLSSLVYFHRNEPRNCSTEEKHSHFLSEKNFALSWQAEMIMTKEYIAFVRVAVSSFLVVMNAANMKQMIPVMKSKEKA